MRDYDAEIAVMAKQLRLGSHIVSAYKDLAVDNPAEFVCQLLERLLETRAAERAMRCRKKAGFERIKTLEEFEFGHVELPKSFSVDWLKSGKYIKDCQNLILIGNSGTGKTHLATALGIQACGEGEGVLFFRASKLVEQLVTMHEHNSIRTFWKRLDSCSLLIIDEWGYIPIHQTGTRLLFEVIADCYEKRSVIVTTNLPPAEWNRILGDDRLAVALMDRLFHHGVLIRHTGGSYRQSHSLMKQCN